MSRQVKIKYETILTLIFLLLVTTRLAAQVEIPEFDFSNLKSVDSMTFHKVNDSDSWKLVRYFRNNRVTKVGYFDNRKLSRYSLFWYDDKKQLSFESSYGKFSSYNTEKGDWDEFWDSTHFDLTVRKMSGKKIIRETRCTVIDADTTINQITTYAYDAKQRMLSMVSRDVFVGIVGSFRSNSTDIKEFENKRESIEYSKLFRYELNKVEVVCKVNGQVTGKEIGLVDYKGNFTSIKQYSFKDELLSGITAAYNEKGLLRTRSWKTYSSVSVWGLESDVLMDGTDTIEYDNMGRPIKVVTDYVGGHRTISVYHYF